MRRILQYLILGVLANALALFGVDYLLGDMGFSIAPLWGFLVIGAVLGIMNAIVKPILSLLSLPFIILSMGLFLVVINGILLFLIEYIFAHILTHTGIFFTVGHDWLSYLIAAFLLSLINTITHFFLTKS